VKSLRFIPTSLQIKLRAEHLGLNIADNSLIPYINLVIDGADQIDEHMNMIKGGGGALLREKVLIHATSRAVIVADESKYVDRLDMPIPVEVLPYARSYVVNVLKSEFMADTRIRINERGYPIVTENGNIIVDAKIDMEKYYENGGLSDLESDMKCIAGVIETGLFTKHANIYYRIMKDGSTEVIYT
jgi:ribose 5-phosphate isomerase A